MSALASLANQVQSAGRGPDENLVHMSPAELDYLRQNWGPPTINPQTGLPEYGWFDSVLQYAPAALGAASSFMGGGGMGGSIGSMLGANDAWAPIIGNALIGGGMGALGGGGIKGALMGAALGGGSAALSPLIGNMLGGTDIGNWLGIADTPRDSIFGSGVGRMGVDSIGDSRGSLMDQYFGGGDASRALADPSFTSAQLGRAASAGAGAVGAGGDGSSSWLKAILPAVTLASLAAGGGGQKQAGGAPPPTSDPGMSAKLPDLDYLMTPKTVAEDWYTYGQRPRGASFFDTEWRDESGRPMNAANGGQVRGYAGGGALGALGQSRYVGDGPGSGRDDLIEARLSPNEYVISAEETSMLGDGNPDEGARRLDRMRENLRKDKGRALVKGKISGNAKRPEQYMRGKG